MLLFVVYLEVLLFVVYLEVLMFVVYLEVLVFVVYIEVLMFVVYLECYSLSETTGSWSGDSKTYGGHQSLRPPLS